MLLQLSQTIKTILEHKINQIKSFNCFDLLIDENNTKTVRYKADWKVCSVRFTSTLLFASIQQTDTSHSSVDLISLNFISFSFNSFSLFKIQLSLRA